MLKKILIVVGLLFLFLSNKAIAPSTIGFSQEAAAAASKETPKQTGNAETDSPVGIKAYILPGLAGIVIIGGIASYWLVFRKRVV
ncbi:hypothetical protein D1B31_07340 [Neobacillus notoginsengisoli]|uniref:LPXTG cell wall anchor domain-containing protein n=1 Tax=Neobacillus notoginsengisoli TaxID=1578198 RepID=A0A417YW60_9BACI|nr:hypothetical protein [Neobacillus notoginsengisoli]RHW41528.1 hypothetical protein D1B31_07340 [Neobacillus notoginsengisoli]